MEKTTINHSNTSIRADTLRVMLFMQSLIKQDKKKSNYQTSKITSFPVHAHILHMVILHLMIYHRSWPCDWSVFNQGSLISPKRKYKTRIANLSNKTLSIKWIIPNHDFYPLSRCTKLNTFPFFFSIIFWR